MVYKIRDKRGRGGKGSDLLSRTDPLDKMQSRFLLKFRNRRAYDLPLVVCPAKMSLCSEIGIPAFATSCCFTSAIESDV